MSMMKINRKKNIKICCVFTFADDFFLINHYLLMVNDGAVKCLFDAVLSRVALSDGDSITKK